MADLTRTTPSSLALKSVAAIERTLRGDEQSRLGPRARQRAFLSLLVVASLFAMLVPTSAPLRALLVVITVSSAGAAVLLHRPGNLQRFVLGDGPAVNLAVARIGVFATFLIFRAVHDASYFSQLPSELLVPPQGLDAVASLVNNPSLVRGLTVAFVIATACTIIGLYTRPAAVASVMLGLFVLGVPQFFGKVNHYHHLIWIAAVIAVSRCGDSLSVDAWREAQARAKRGEVRAPDSSMAYALPLRLVWLLIGVVYFFPGFWKFVSIGPSWALSDNLRNQMLNKWAELGSSWQPLFRIDEYPLLYRSSGVFTLAFELFFVVLILTPFLRRLAVLAGLAFHNATGVMMGILFGHLQAMYVTLVNWDYVFRWVGSRSFHDLLVIEYREDDPRARRAACLLLSFDVLGALSVRPSTSCLAASDGLHVVAKDEAILIGVAGWRAAARRVPPLWPLLALPDAALGRLVFEERRRTRRSRKVVRHEDGPHDQMCLLGTQLGAVKSWRRDPSVAAVAIVGSVILVAASFGGLSRVHHAWPFSVYPTFAYEAAPETSEVLLEFERSDGSVEVMGRDEFNLIMSPERLTPVVLRIADAPDPRTMERRLDAFLTAMELRGIVVEDVETVRIRRMRISTDPNSNSEPVLADDLLGSVTVVRQ